MREKLKKAFRRIVMVFNIVFIFILLFLVAYAFFVEEDMMDGGLTNFISLVALLLGIPTLYTGLKDIYYPDKKKICLTGKCPNCRHLVEYQLEED